MSRDDPPIPAELVADDAPAWADELDAELEIVEGPRVAWRDPAPKSWGSALAAHKLASQLDEAVVVGEAPVPHEWELENRAQVEWAMRRLAVLLDRAGEVRALASGWAARIDAWQDAELRRVQPGIDRFSGLLERYGRRARAENPKEATIRVPSGEIKTTKPKQPTVTVVDEAAVLSWLLDEVSVDLYDEVVRTDPKLKLTEFRQAVSVAYELLPVCQVCGENLEVVSEVDVHPDSEVGVWHENRAVRDHDPMPSGGYVVRLDKQEVPGVVAELGEITAKPVLNR